MNNLKKKCFYNFNNTEVLKCFNQKRPTVFYKARGNNLGKILFRSVRIKSREAILDAKERADIK